MPTPSTTHADIGSDHAGLLKDLLNSGVIECGIAIENKRQPYLNSVQTLLNLNAEVRFANGLEALTAGEVDSLSISGLGAKTIIEILERFPDRVPKHVILQPVKYPELIREWAIQNGYEFLDERVVIGKRSYTTLSFASPTLQQNGSRAQPKPEPLLNVSTGLTPTTFDIPTKRFQFFRSFNSLPDTSWVSSNAPFSTRTTDQCFQSDSLADTFLRAIAEEHFLPMKEVFETFEFFEEIRKQTRSKLVVDLCCGHGLLGILFALFERSVERVILIDRTELPSRSKLIEISNQVAPWVAPKLDCLVEKIAIDNSWIEHGCAIVSAHACGTLSDLCIDIAIKSQGPIAILPCCYPQSACRAPQALQLSLGLETAFDVDRTYRLEAVGYRVRWSTIPESITPMNRILSGRIKSTSLNTIAQ